MLFPDHEDVLRRFERKGNRLSVYVAANSGWILEQQKSSRPACDSPYGSPCIYVQSR